MAALGILREYAKKSIPSPALPGSILFAHTDATLTIFDAYPKAMFHFLIMPRLLPSMETAKYRNLRTLLQWDRAKAKEIILKLQEDSKQTIADVEEEMIRLHGFKWKIWTGFHAVPNMDHLHLHIVSSDLVSPSLKNKKHYNSFYPKAGFFLHLDDVLEWFEGDESYYATMSALPIARYEPLLKEDLKCWRCHAIQKNIPTLKTHLQEEWDKEKRKETVRKKRKREDVTAAAEGENAEDPDSTRHTERLERAACMKPVETAILPSKFVLASIPKPPSTQEQSYVSREDFCNFDLYYIFVVNLRQKLTARSLIVKDAANTSYNTEKRQMTCVRDS